MDVPNSERNNANYFSAPKVKDGETLKSYIKDNSEKKIGKMAHMRSEEAKEGISELCQDTDVLDYNTQKVGVRVEAVQELHGNVSKLDNLSKIAECLIFSIESYMSWEGKDARNPMLARMSIQMLEWIFLRSKKLSYGLIPVVLPFLIAKVPDRKHGASVCKVLWAMCWQYQPEVMLSQVFGLCMTLPSEKHWTPVLVWICQVINTFGINNCNPIHHLHYTQSLLVTAKQEASKQACYKIIFSIYQQLGKNWEKTCLGPLDGRLRETLTKEMKEKGTLKTFKQLRVTQGEVPPLPLEYQSLAAVTSPSTKSSKSKSKNKNKGKKNDNKGKSKEKTKASTPASAAKKGKKNSKKDKDKPSSTKSKRDITPKISITSQVGKSGFMTGDTPPTSTKAMRSKKSKKGKQSKPSSARFAAPEDHSVTTVLNPIMANPELENQVNALEERVGKVSKSKTNTHTKKKERTMFMIVYILLFFVLIWCFFQLEAANKKLLKKISQLEEKLSENNESKSKESSVGAHESSHEMFSNFLEFTVGLPQYMKKFEKVDCADIRMVEHFDDEFFKDTLGIKNPIHLKLFKKYIQQFNNEANNFKKTLIKSDKPKLKHYVLKFEKQGVITWSILSEKCKTKNDLKNVFEIENEEHLNALYKLIVNYRNGEMDIK